MADGEVRVLSSGLVQAEGLTKLAAAAEERIPLTPCDLRIILFGTIQKGLLFQKPTNPSIDQATLIQTLKSSFSRALALFYPFAGRLSVDKHDDDGTASIYIDCNNAGALFAHAVADGVSVADILDPLYVPPVLWSFFPLNWMMNYHGFSQPFIAVQVTELVDGFFLGCTISHAVADGPTFWRFVNFWSQICRYPGGGGDSANKSQVFTRRWFLDEKHLPIRLPAAMLEDFKQDPIPIPPQELKERVFHFTREKLAALKAQANDEAVAAAGGDGQISTLQTLISHIWRAVFRNRSEPDPDREAHFHLHFGLRQRLQPKVPENYFGNAIVGRPVGLKVSELLEAEKGLGRVAAAIHGVVAEQTDEKLKEAVEDWIGNPKFVGTDVFVTGTMGLSSSPRYDVYGNDFGWGKPVAVRSGAGNKFDGKVTVFPGVEAGSMDVEICLSPETAEGVGRDLEFMAAVGV
ncbi:unnamed protein product [Linum trigynum]|uniref:HXXXD-type acyl-transferase family protein n=1 Tax=Linum trigynum TaxID=586398 RepID=A0AAV2D5A3_9ROSI